MKKDSTPETRAKHATTMREYRKKNPEMFRNADLKKCHGITLDEYNLMLKSQNSVCAICHNPERAVRNYSTIPRNLAVDHCHTTGKIRGLLCTQCNQGIGNFRENANFMASAISYLLTHN